MAEYNQWECTVQEIKTANIEVEVKDGQDPEEYALDKYEHGTGAYPDGYPSFEVDCEMK